MKLKYPPEVGHTLSNKAGMDGDWRPHLHPKKSASHPLRRRIRSVSQALPPENQLDFRNNSHAQLGCAWPLFSEILPVRGEGIGGGLDSASNSPRPKLINLGGLKIQFITKHFAVFNEDECLRRKQDSTITAFG